MSSAGRSSRISAPLEQALLLREHRGFADLDAYRQFVAETLDRLNGRVVRKFNEERGMLIALPARRSRFDEKEPENVSSRLPPYLYSADASRMNRLANCSAEGVSGTPERVTRTTSGAAKSLLSVIGRIS